MSPLSSPNRQLAESLALRGDSLLAQGYAEDAESLYFQSLTLHSNNPPLLRKIGQLYRALGREEESRLCQRGVIPDAANERYFDSGNLTARLTHVADSPSTKTSFTSDPEQIALTPPTPHGRPGHYNQFKRAHTDCRGTFVTRTTHGEVWFDGLNTLIIDAGRQILTEHSKGNDWLAWRAASVRTPTTLTGRVCFIDARSSSIYYHWMLDVLPKLDLLRQAGIALDSIDKFVVKATSAFQLDTLQALGIPSERLHYLKGGTHIVADELIVPYLKNDLGDKVYSGLGVGAASWIPGFLKNSFLDEDTRQQQSAATRRLYITRQDATSRRIVNEQEIEAILHRHGFETYAFDGKTVEEQAQIMFETEYVVAPHGAGLTNLAFCQPRAKLLEIFGDYIVPCYWSLANLVGMDYHYFMADPVEAIDPDVTTEKDADVARRRAKDLYVDPDVLTRALQRFFEESSR